VSGATDTDPAVGTVTFTMPSADVTVSTTSQALWKITGISSVQNVSVTSDVNGNIARADGVPAGTIITLTASCTVAGSTAIGFKVNGATVTDTDPAMNILTFAMPAANISLDPIRHDVGQNVIIGDTEWAGTNFWKSTGTFATTPMVYDGAANMSNINGTAFDLVFGYFPCPNADGWRRPTADNIRVLLDSGSKQWKSNYMYSGVSGVEIVTPGGVLFFSATSSTGANAGNGVVIYAGGGGPNYPSGGYYLEALTFSIGSTAAYKRETFATLPDPMTYPVRCIRTVVK
jgi:hypothetical protein